MRTQAVSLALCTLAIGAPASASASEFCDQFKSILADSGNRFTDLRSDFDFVTHRYVGSVLLVPFSECTTRYKGKNSSYDCLVPYDDKTEADVIGKVNEVAESIKECLQSDVSASKIGKDSWSFSVRSTQEEISLISGQAKSTGQRFMAISISYVDFGT